MGLLLLTDLPTGRCGRPYRVLPDGQWEESFIFPLAADHTVLGRRPDAVVGGLLLPHPEVDRTHAVIQHRPDGYYIEDSHSHNGTTINGEPLTNETPRKLEEGDRIGIVGYEFEFRSASETSG